MKTLMIVLLFSGTAMAQPKINPLKDLDDLSKEISVPKKEKEVLKRLLTPNEINSLVLQDLLTLTPAQALTTRYIWNQNPSSQNVQSVSITLNRISRSVSIFRPVPLSDNRLVRFDISQLSFDIDTDLKEIIEIWEQLRFDPNFNLLLTQDALKVIFTTPKESWPKAIVRNENQFETFLLDDVAQTDVIRVLPDHLDPKIALAIQSLTCSSAPVVSKEYFETRVLASIKGKDVYKTVWGGLYYDFKGIKKSTKKGQTDLEKLQEDVGATGKRSADQRVAMFESGVTGKPRAITFLPATNLRVGDGQSAIVITNDVRDDSIDSSQNAMQTLDPKTFKPDGFEVIFQGANGINCYALFNGKGELVEEVPQEIASDTTVPKQYTKRLQAAMSCIRCHEATGNDGWHPVTNDVQTLVNRGLDVFGDVSKRNQTISRTLQDLGSQYKGNPEKFIRNARWNYQAAILESGGAWIGSAPNDVLKVSSGKLRDDVNEYWYGRVTPEKALKRLGFLVVDNTVKGEQALQFLQRLLKPDVDSKVFGIQPEDVRIGALLLDMPISQQEFGFIYSFAQSRANKELKGILEKGSKQ